MINRFKSKVGVLIRSCCNSINYSYKRCMLAVTTLNNNKCIINKLKIDNYIYTKNFIF